MSTSWRRHWDNLQERIQEEFIKRGTILSYDEYLALMWRQPTLHLRNSAQYLRDVFEHYGSVMIDSPVGKLRRFKLFDAPFGDVEDRVIGQELVQAAIHQIIGNFVREGRINKLIMLHGPNGSAKSLLVRAMMMALEDYATTDQGVSYSFNWVFPAERMMGGSIGFTSPSGRTLPSESFAYLASEQIDARVPCEMHDHPLFLIPQDKREMMFLRMQEQGLLPDSFKLSDYIRKGDLCHKCRRIYESMLANYEGDQAQLLRHIQVERLYLSRRYRRGAVSVEPQLSVDAQFQQVTADRSLASLPRTLQHVALFEPSGALVDANRGIMEFSDMLKRPVEHFKYLLSTVENATVAMDSLILYLDTVLMATTNDKYLDAFKSHPDFPSFKGRLELIRVPYLRRLSQDVEIFTNRITSQILGRHIAPHAIRVASLFSVLTRLQPPLKTDDLPASLIKVVTGLSPMEKLRLYDRAEPPEALTSQEARELRALIPDIYRQYDDHEIYEGRVGASAREIRTVLLNAAMSEEHACLHPQAVFEELRRLIKQHSLFEFLRVDEEKGYHTHETFVNQVEDTYLDWVDKEVQNATGLATETSYAELFGRYIAHVSHWTKGEKIEDPISGAFQDPDKELMNDVEKVIRPRGEDTDVFRKSLISKVGAYALEHPDKLTEYTQVFPQYVEQLREDFFMRRREKVRRLAEQFLDLLASEDGMEIGRAEALNDNEAKQVQEMLSALTKRHGYCRDCARDTVAFLVRRRYAGP